MTLAQTKLFLGKVDSIICFTASNVRVSFTLWIESKCLEFSALIWLQTATRNGCVSHTVHLILLLLQGLKSVTMLIALPQGLPSALKSQTLSNLTCSKYIYRSKWVNRFWLVKALSGIVEGGQNDSQIQSQLPVRTFGSTAKTGSWLILTSTATSH